MPRTPFLRSLAVVTFLIAASAPASASGLELGIQDPQVESSAAPSDLPTAAARVKAAGGTHWRFLISWRAVNAERPPSSTAAADPAWAGYAWTRVDQQVRAIRGAGLSPLPFVMSAPDWAEGAGRPSTSEAPAGTWKPNAAAFKAFAAALATRYSGEYPDPVVAGQTLPRVATWQAWNEPNLAEYLTPQWTKTGSKYALTSASTFRGLVNAFYDGAKSIDRTLRIVTAGTSPFGDLTKGGKRTAPVLFWRDLLCVTGAAKPTARKCPQIRFDAFAHHPYPIGPPNRPARNANDVSVPDLGKLNRIVEPARKRGTIKPKGTKPLWVTEISWDSAPDPDGLSLADQALYLQGALNVFSRAKASVVIWFNLRDQAPIPSYPASYQSGLYARGSTIEADIAKPSLTAFSFPFTAYRTSGVAHLWGMAPTPGPIEIQAQTSAGWTKVIDAKAGANRLFTGRLRVNPGTRLRAISGAAVSLTWTTS